MKHTILYVGDLHARVEHLARVDDLAKRMGVRYVVQVGDFGMYFCGKPGSDGMRKYFDKRARQGRAGPVWFTCGGNHENWPRWREMRAEQGDPVVTELAPGCHYVERGGIVNIHGVSHLFMGGAESTDRLYRVPDVSWWAEESPDRQELQLFFDRFDEDQPDVVVTHDCPARIQPPRSFKDGERDSRSTPRALEGVLRASDHRPAYWMFGHHHDKQSWDDESTRYWCCGEKADCVALELGT